MSKNNLTVSHSSSALMNINVHSPTTLFRNDRRYKSNDNIYDVNVDLSCTIFIPDVVVKLLDIDDELLLSFDLYRR
ncbi:unnamed protein product, partial [Rotaria sp. Silwood1]